MNTYREEYIVDFRDVDRNYHIKFPQLLEILGTVSTKHTNSVGIDPYYLSSRGFAWILYEWKIEMIETKLYARPIKIETFGIDKRGMYFIRYFGIYDETDRIIGRGFSKWVIIDLEKRRISKIPSEILEAFRIEGGQKSKDREWIMDLSDDTLRSGTLKEEGWVEHRFPLRYYDIDPNQHVNNAKYLEWAIESLHGEKHFLQDHIPRSVCIVYKKEKSPDGEVVCYVQREEQTTRHQIFSSEGELLTIVEINWKETAPQETGVWERKQVERK